MRQRVVLEGLALRIELADAAVVVDREPDRAVVGDLHAARAVAERRDVLGHPQRLRVDLADGAVLGHLAEPDRAFLVDADAIGGRHFRNLGVGLGLRIEAREPAGRPHRAVGMHLDGVLAPVVLELADLLRRRVPAPELLGARLGEPHRAVGRRHRGMNQRRAGMRWRAMPFSGP